MNSILNITRSLPPNVVYSAVCGLVLVGTYVHFKIKYSYWSKFGIKGDNPIPFFGEFYTILMNDPLELQRKRVKKFGRVYGAYINDSPTIVIADPEVIRQILIKDFDVFTDHCVGSFANKFQKLFLVWIKGDQWKKTRSLMSPTFTSAKIKRMFKLIDSCAEDLIAVFREQLATSNDDGTVVNLVNIYGLFTMDGITTCCYGLKLERESDDSDRSTASRSEFVNIAQKSGITISRFMMARFFPKVLLKMFGFEIAPSSALEPLIKRLEKLIEIRRNSPRKTSDFLQSLVDAKLGDEMELNEMDMQENHHAGLTHESLIRDQQKIIDDLELNGNKQVRGSNKFGLSNMEIISEAVFLLIAGFETTSILLTGCSYSLAFHQDIQQRLYEEIKKIAKFDGEKNQFDYEEITSCQYLDSVISETLRFLSPAFGTDRRALEDYYIEKYGVYIPKGFQVMIAIHAVQNDPEYWHEPEKFNPERFMPGNKEKIVPGSYLPFSMGPRHCIGMRFSLTEAKLGLAKIIMKFKFEPASGTEFPPKLSLIPGLIRLRNPIVRVFPRE